MDVADYGPAWLLLAFLLVLIVVGVKLAWPRRPEPVPIGIAMHDAKPGETVRILLDGKEIARSTRSATHSMRAFNEAWHGREYTPCKAALMDMGSMLDRI